MNGDHSLHGRVRMVGVLEPSASSLILAWLASHRDRLYTLVFGGKRLSLLVVWDRKGDADVDRSDLDIVAIRQVAYGDRRRP